jgi:hypothetical protein
VTGLARYGGGMDRGCGCGLRQYAGLYAAEKARDRGNPGTLGECPRRAGVWHLVPATSDTGPTAEVRRLVLERDGYRCVCCGLPVAGQRYSLGHRLRASQGGLAVPSNLLTFLGWGGQGCHGRIDNRADPRDEDRGLTVRSWQDPALVPVTLLDGRRVRLADDGRYHDTPPVGAVA